MFYFICASSLNNLLLRKDLCHWTKGMQIRYNISHLEQWARDQKLSDNSVMKTLEPIIQASQLLQARKTEDDIPSLCDMCDQLTVQRVRTKTMFTSLLTKLVVFLQFTSQMWKMSQFNFSIFYTIMRSVFKQLYWTNSNNYWEHLFCYANRKKSENRWQTQRLLGINFMIITVYQKS